ncbi:recombinase family protein [Dongia sp.]|uniref:recombinase family protein n=1 Tax=Dongia sp. TaxID=1977262 RepID=UPI0035B3E8BB
MRQVEQAASKFIAYLRVSTERQGRSGLGLEAQREAVQRHVQAQRGELIAPDYVEVESGKRNDRPELEKALRRCRLTGATLIVAKLDRLSRNAAFLMTLRDSGVRFLAADLPEANTMTVGIMALVAQHEREAISSRTRAALAASKARGTVLGGRRANAADIRQHQPAGVLAASRAAQAKAEDRRELFAHLRGLGLSLRGIADRLNADGVLTSRAAPGGWTASAVQRTLARLGID